MNTQAVWILFSLITSYLILDANCIRIHPGRVKRAQISDTSKNSLTQADRDEFLNLHNTYRQNVNPTATNMLKMEWNAELESTAQEWANNCVYAHGHPTRSNPEFNDPGQNIWAASGGYDIAGSVKDWHDEVIYYTYSTGTCLDRCGHYTQVVWSSNYALGCGIAYCPGLFSNGGYYIVCNYGPGGNYVGQKPYASGTSCSSCPVDRTCENNLCAATSDNTGGDTGGGSGGDGPSVSDGVRIWASYKCILLLLLCVLLIQNI